MAVLSTTQLREQYAKLKNEGLRIRDAARRIGVSELELLELELGGNVVRLEGDWTDFLKQAHTLGHVMALTRNEYAVHERKGVYQNVSFVHDGNMGVAVNPDIDLRFLMWNWKYGYAVRMEQKNRVLHAFQFFDARGEAVHKIYLTGRSKPEAFQALLEKFRAEDQHTLTEVDKEPLSPEESIPDEDIDIAAFREEWLALQDTHDFFPLLKKYGLQRRQAFRLAPDGYARQVRKDAIVEVLQQAADKEVPIMVFVNSKGCIQIHTGAVKKLVPMKNWFNIMDPEFNLHLNTEGIAEAWVARKPTKDGIVTSLEVFDEEGSLIVYLFGKRKPGIPELEGWRAIVNESDLALTADAQAS